MSEDSQPAPELVSLLPRPHTREFLHKHGPGAVIHRHSHDYHQLIYVSTGVLAIHTERAPTGRAQPRRN